MGKEQGRLTFLPGPGLCLALVTVLFNPRPQLQSPSAGERGDWFDGQVAPSQLGGRCLWLMWCSHTD